MQGKNLQEKAWKQTYLVDRKQIESFAKDIPKMFPFSTTVAPWTEKISKFFAENDQSQIKIAKEEKATFHKLSQICMDVHSFREQLKNYDQTHQFLVKIQNSSENILGKLEAFRGKMGSSYEQLADEQDKLKEELQFLDKKIEYMGKDDYQEQKENVRNVNVNKEVKIWDRERQRKEMKSTSPKQFEQPQKLTIIEQKMREREKEVENIEKEISSLGRNLGWPEEDHNDFISIWHRGPTSKNYFQIEEQLQGYFAFYTGQQIQQHMNKYLRLRKLNEEKKELIAKFKNLKEEKKIQELRLLNLEKDKSKDEREKIQSRKRQEKEQIQMKEKIVEWKQIKIKQKKAQEERKRQDELQRQRQEQMKRRQKIEMNKQKVDYWKQKEAEKQQSLRRVQSARKQPTVTKQVEERIRARQQQLVMKKIEIVNERKKEEQMQKQKEVKMKEEKYVRYSHVNNKLDHKTTAIKEKERQKFDGKQRKDANTFGGQLLMTGVRATPNWMKGL